MASIFDVERKKFNTPSHQAF